MKRSNPYNPYLRDDFSDQEHSFDSLSASLLAAYTRDHGRMREMVRHQLDSYEYFIKVQEEMILKSMNPIFIKSEDDLISPGKYRTELRVYMENLQSDLPKIQEPNGEFRLLFPSEARVRGITYSSRQTIQFRLEYLQRDEEGKEIHHETVLLPRMFFMNMYVMVRSFLCNIKAFPQLSPQTINECCIDPGGHFLVKGQEKTTMFHLNKRMNNLLVQEGNANQKFRFHATIRYAQEGSFGAAKQIDMYVMNKGNLVGFPLMVMTPRMREKEYINLVVLFLALGATSHLEMLHLIFDPTSVTTDQREVIEQFFFATLYAKPEEVVDQVTAVEWIKESIEFDVNHYIREEANDKRKMNQTLTLLKDELFPQYRYPIGMLVSAPENGYTVTFCNAHRQEKRMMLGYMARQLIWTALGWIQPDSRDSYLNKRMNGVNVMFHDFMRPNLHKVVKIMQSQMSKHYRKERKRALKENTQLVWQGLFNESNMTKMFRSFVLQKNFDKAMQTGDFSTTGYAKRVGYCQPLKRLSMMDTIGHLRRISTSADKNNEDIIENRKADAKHVGHLCLLETPDTSAVGQILQLAVGTHPTLPSTSVVLKETIERLSEEMGIRPIGSFLISNQEWPKLFHQTTKLFLNGIWTSLVLKPVELFQELKRRKCSGQLHIYTSIVFDYTKNELRVTTDSGRTVRPVLRVRDGKIMLSREQVTSLRAGKIHWVDLVTGGSFYPEGVIEYIDAEEQAYSSLAIPEVATKRKPVAPHIPLYDYAEISYSFHLGLCAALIPEIGMNPSARNTYESNMGKQAVGLYTTNHAKRMDRNGFVQAFPGVPLSTTALYHLLDFQYVACGKQVILGLNCGDGSNQEDSMTVNASSLDRGLMTGFMYHTEKEEDKTVFPLQQVNRRPDPATTLGIKDADYSKLNSYSVMNPNDIVHPNTVFMGKVVPLTGVKAHMMTNPGMQFEDHSHVHTRTPEDAYVQSNYVGRGGDGQLITKTTLRMFRTVSLGDKSATRQAQKVTVGRKVPGHFMPYTLTTGLTLDILYNLHCIPTRMTIAMVVEMAAGKLCLCLGSYWDASQKHSIPQSKMGTLQYFLAKCGMDRSVQDTMVDPLTGKVLTVKMFNGPMYQQNLKHQTIDKAHFRNIGPNVQLTRQPTEGRSKDGGTKFGEMEQNVMMASGCVEIVNDRLYESSDKYEVYTCMDCGIILAGNNGEEYHRSHFQNPVLAAQLFRKEFYCLSCKHRNRAAKKRIPYAFKLFLQEMMSINVVLRLQ